MKVLIAEDDRNIRAGLEEILQDEGYETVVAEDGTQALTLFRQELPDFICLDIMMPGGRRLRGLPGDPPHEP